MDSKEKPWPEYKGIPVFPFKPDSVMKGFFRVIEQGELQNEDAVRELIRLLYLDPDFEFKYYYKDSTPIDTPLHKAINDRDIIVKKTEWRFYKHPKFKRDYIKIPKQENYRWDWEREVVEKGPEFVEDILELSPRKRSELDIINKVHIEEQYREQLKKQKYNFDVFLSYSEKDKESASIIHSQVSESGGKIYMAPKQLDPGDDFAEEIRQALIGSKELWLLVSPNSIASEWVITEWGAAWALQKRIVPILLRCDHTSLPDRLKKLKCIDMHMINDFIRGKFSKSKHK